MSEPTGAGLPVEPSGKQLIKLILLLAYPVAFSRILQALAAIIDIAMVGGLGAAATAAVGTSRQLIFIAEMLMVSVITGAMAVTAQYIGQGLTGKAAAVLQQSFVVLAAISILLGIMGYFASPALLSLVGAEGEVWALGLDYMQLFFVGLWAMALSHLIISVMQASGDTLTPFFIFTAVNILHIVGNHIFINGLDPIPALGVRGAALGQIGSRVIGLLIGLTIIYSGWYRIDMRRQPALVIDWLLIRRIMGIGLPVTMQGLLKNGASILFLRVIATTPSATLGLAAFAIGSRLAQFALLVANAFATVALILVGQSLGAGHNRAAERRGWMTLQLSLVVMVVIGIIFFVFARPLVAFFSSDPAVIQTGVWFVRILALSQPFIALGQVLAGALQGAGDTRPPLYYTLISQWLIGLPLAYVLTFSLGLGLTGVWVAVAISPVAQGILTVNKFRSGSWKTRLVEA
jgi:putative MATE family efflux protein